MDVLYCFCQRVQGVEVHLFQKVDRCSPVNSSIFTILYCRQNFNSLLTCLPFRSKNIPEFTLQIDQFAEKSLPWAGRWEAENGRSFRTAIGNYRLIALLGQGSYAEVYLRQHVRLELQAAIKVLHGHLTSREAECFQQEAQTMERLTHPSIVRMFDFAVQDGIPFLIMEYAPNGSLRQRYPEGSIISLSQIIPSIKQVAAALQYAHEQKIIYLHRCAEDPVGFQQQVLDFLRQFQAGSTDLLRHVGLLPKELKERMT